MDYGNELYDTLRYDDMVLNDTLLFTYQNPKLNRNQTQVEQPTNTINRDVYTKLLEKDAIVNQVKKEILADTLINKRDVVVSQRDHAARHDTIGFCSSCRKPYNDEYDNGSVDLLSDTRFLLFLVIVLAAVCMIQWISYNKQATNMNEMLAVVMATNMLDGKTHENNHNTGKQDNKQ